MLPVVNRVRGESGRLFPLRAKNPLLDTLRFQTQNRPRAKPAILSLSLSFPIGQIDFSPFGNYAFLFPLSPKTLPDLPSLFVFEEKASLELFCVSPKSPQPRLVIFGARRFDCFCLACIRSFRPAQPVNCFSELPAAASCPFGFKNLADAFFKVAVPIRPLLPLRRLDRSDSENKTSDFL